MAYTCCLAIPMGRLAEQGREASGLRGRVLLPPHHYGVLLSGGGGLFAVFGSLLLLGTYYAATDGVLMAIASSMVARESRGDRAGNGDDLL